ncbi:YegS/Rv2252/BmrU family lipid kinase [Salipaludibacillus sp. CUR1]|uniref:diacylglycerol/lipid kinase family protein n=1 Tax=Salipaludibacillus sp. CUR1 TaxID=2820003 RepID=UPI001E2D9FC4|nr:YegS/Rv2252/BmrU family lipid kinase [Salipaludibacillus sp. CUR1]MCE7791639.1 YegS/Rv2252/BmrU family lipid kinase [Salipaludibacillus sp. CUR1]
MYKKGMLLFNDKAGQEDVHKNVGVAAGIISKIVDELIIIKGKNPGDLEKICRERGEEADLLCIMGGDGTVHDCVNGLVHLSNPPVISVLPSGTCNDFARSLNLPANISEAAGSAVKGFTKKIDIGYANDRTFINFAGIGLITDTSENINKEMKEWVGSFSYLMSAMKTVNETEPFHYKIRLPDEELEGEAVMIALLNGKYIGTRELPFEGISLLDRQLNLVVVKEGGLSLFIEWIQRKTPFSKETENNNLILRETSDVHIALPEDKKADTDGEVYLRSPLKCGIIEKPLEFICGEKEEN